MKMPESFKKVVGGILLVGLLVVALLLLKDKGNNIKSVTLTSPGNLAFQNQLEITLEHPASIYVRYWIKGSSDKYRTPATSVSDSFKIPLLLLETDTTYDYQIVVEGTIPKYSKTLSFTTREQSPWLVYNWVKEENPHDASSLGNGLVMLCFGRTPGYVTMVDGKGAIRWYWQIDDIGVRAARLTGHGTVLAMLRPVKLDVIDDTPKSNAEIIQELHVPMRRGSIGFAGGTAIAEVGLDGQLLWRLDMKTLPNPEYHVIHHDVLMDADGNICTLYRPKKIFDLSKVGGAGIDTLGGDGILVIDKTGKEIWKWSVWDEWNIANDPNINEYKYDRFHMNSLSFDRDSNFLVSVAVEDQVWKINRKTGKVMWKFGKNGDFKMDTTYSFSFQHTAHTNSDGDLMLMDNSLFRKESRGLSFTLDTVSWTATNKICAPLPTNKYTSRMGSSYLLPNGNLLQTSAKTGTVLVTSSAGENVHWELNSFYVPYRAEYVPADTWKKFFIKE